MATTAATVETAATVKAAEAGLSAKRVAPRDTTVVESAECTGVHPASHVATVKAAFVSTKAAAMVEVGVKVVAINDRPAMREVRVVVVDDSAAVMPVVPPVVPAPPKAAKKADSEA